MPLKRVKLVSAAPARVLSRRPNRKIDQDEEDVDIPRKPGSESEVIPSHWNFVMELDFRFA